MADIVVWLCGRRLCGTEGPHSAYKMAKASLRVLCIKESSLCPPRYLPQGCLLLQRPGLSKPSRPAIKEIEALAKSLYAIPKLLCIYWATNPARNIELHTPQMMDPFIRNAVFLKMCLVAYIFF